MAAGWAVLYKVPFHSLDAAAPSGFSPWALLLPILCSVKATIGNAHNIRIPENPNEGHSTQQPYVSSAKKASSLLHGSTSKGDFRRTPKALRTWLTSPVPFTLSTL